MYSFELRFRRNWSDSKGAHTRAYSTNEFDYYAIYCPEKDKVLYVLNKKNCPKALRFDKPSNNQARNIKWAENYLLIK